MYLDASWLLYMTSPNSPDRKIIVPDTPIEKIRDSDSILNAIRRSLIVSPLTLHSATSGISRPENEDMKTEGKSIMGRTMLCKIPYEDRALSQDFPLAFSPRGISICCTVVSPDRMQALNVTGRVILFSLF